MTEFNQWILKIKHCYNDSSLFDYTQLQAAVLDCPSLIFENIDQPNIGEGFAYWLDACHKLCHHYQDEDPELAFSYLQLAYAKMQRMVCLTTLSLELKRWSLKRLDAMIVAILEFCQKQSELYWQHQSTQLINLHVVFMESQQHINLQYGITA